MRLLGSASQKNSLKLGKMGSISLMKEMNAAFDSAYFAFKEHSALMAIIPFIHYIPLHFHKYIYYHLLLHPQNFTTNQSVSRKRSLWISKFLRTNDLVDLVWISSQFNRIQQDATPTSHLLIKTWKSWQPAYSYITRKYLP